MMGRNSGIILQPTLLSTHTCSELEGYGICYVVADKTIIILCTMYTTYVIFRARVTIMCLVIFIYEFFYLECDHRAAVCTTLHKYEI